MTPPYAPTACPYNMSLHRDPPTLCPHGAFPTHVPPSRPHTLSPFHTWTLLQPSLPQPNPAGLRALPSVPTSPWDPTGRPPLPLIAHGPEGRTKAPFLPAVRAVMVFPSAAGQGDAEGKSSAQAEVDLRRLEMKGGGDGEHLEGHGSEGGGLSDGGDLYNR